MPQAKFSAQKLPVFTVLNPFFDLLLSPPFARPRGSEVMAQMRSQCSMLQPEP